MPKEKLTEITRSFSYKLNIGNYETRDFFCSQKLEVPESEAVKASEELFEFCKDEVMKSVYGYKLENLPKKEPQKKSKSFYQLVKEAEAEDRIENTGVTEKQVDEANKRLEEQLPIIEE